MKSLLRPILGLLLSLATVTSSQSYASGEQAAPNSAILVIPEQFELLALDDQRFGNMLFNSTSATEKALTPGPHNILVRYHDFMEWDESEHETFKSEPILLSFQADAKQRYRIDFKQPKTPKAARQFEDNPKIWLQNQTQQNQASAQIRYQVELQNEFNQFLTRLTASDGRSANQVASQSSPPVATAAPVTTHSTPTSQAASTGQPLALESLKHWWLQANPKQRQQFQQWLQQQ